MSYNSHDPADHEFQGWAKPDMRRIWWWAVLLLVLGGLPAGPALAGPSLALSAQEATMQIYSSAFANGGIIPRQYTCEGKDFSPPLRWEGIPAGTQSLALIVEDPDAPDPAAPQRIWVHWVLYDIPPHIRELSAGVQKLPPGAREGINDWLRRGYGGPCPPIGRHRYFFRLYALDTTLPVLPSPDKDSLQAAMHGHVLAEATLMGRYAKGDR